MFQGRDIVTLIKPDGTVIEDIKANVQPTTIVIFDIMVPLEERDRLYRKLPNGLIETFLVLDRCYYSGRGSFPERYEAKVKKEAIVNEEKFKSIKYIYHVNGTNAKLYIRSTDNSSNHYNDCSNLFDEIRRVLEELEEKEIKEQSLQILEELKSNQNTPSFLSHYQNFIAVLANKMTIISPFIPELTKMIKPFIDSNS